MNVSTFLFTAFPPRGKICTLASSFLFSGFTLDNLIKKLININFHFESFWITAIRHHKSHKSVDSGRQREIKMLKNTSFFRFYNFHLIFFHITKRERITCFSSPQIIVFLSFTTQFSFWTPQQKKNLISISPPFTPEYKKNEIRRLWISDEHTTYLLVYIIFFPIR